MTTAIESPNRSDAEVEAAMSLLGSGLSSVQVSALTDIPASTLRDWARSSALVTKYGDAIKEARTRITMRTSQIVERVLDEIEDGTVKVSPVQALTMWGIATDKVQKDEPHQRDENAPPFAIIVIRDASTAPDGVKPDDNTETIEGTAREVSE